MSRRRLAVDPVRCQGHGHCASLLPELIGLDEWGYPLISREAVPGALDGEARRTLQACPTLALRLVDADPERHRR